MTERKQVSDWTPIVGLEIHAELMTKSKMFSACPVVDSVTAPPNTAVDAVSMGLPGTLPVINQTAVEMAMMVGLALHCEIPPVNQFARKSYFYPDLPKGYQISQYDRPICVNGYLDIELSDGTTERIRVRRAHLEEDTGKSIHVGNASLIDLNRAGVPLLEIVTEPDIHSAEAAEAFARKLRAILQYLGVNNGDMSKGVMRVEPNISVQHKDDTGYRTRTEVKNLNSIRSLYRSIEYEVERQIKAWENRTGVRQATMGWDEVKQRTVVQRYKESADEYRYFPEPDLPILEMSREWVEAVRATLPELPDARRDRLIRLGLSAYDASTLVADQRVANRFELMVASGANPNATAKWIMNKLDAEERQRLLDVEAEKLSKLFMLMESDGFRTATITGVTGVAVLNEMWETGKDPASIVSEKGLAQISDTSAVEAAVAQVLDANGSMVQEYLSGRDKLFGPLMGKAMAELKGKGNPAVVKEVLAELLEARRG